MAQDQAPIWQDRHAQWLGYVSSVIRTVEGGNAIPLGPSPVPLFPPPIEATAGEPVKVVYCAPHPDDESLCGALALRLRLEAGARVSNVAITLGSQADQKARRLKELEASCRALGFELVVPAEPSGGSGDVTPGGFERVNLKTREGSPQEWVAKVKALSEIFDREKPDVVFAPHAGDFNTTHIGTHFLVVEAIRAHLKRTRRGPLPLVETEFWHQLSEPNLMVGISPELMARQLVAATEHGGEVSRNPYHLLHPCRMMDNLRRGSEVVGGQGAAAQKFTFAELYRITFLRGKEIVAPRPGGLIIKPEEKVSLAAIVGRFRPEGL